MTWEEEKIDEIYILLWKKSKQKEKNSLVRRSEF